MNRSSEIMELKINSYYYFTNYRKFWFENFIFVETLTVPVTNEVPNFCLHFLPNSSMLLSTFNSYCESILIEL